MKKNIALILVTLFFLMSFSSCWDSSNSDKVDGNKDATEDSVNIDEDTENTRKTEKIKLDKSNLSMYFYINEYIVSSTPTYIMTVYRFHIAYPNGYNYDTEGSSLTPEQEKHLTSKYKLYDLYSWTIQTKFEIFPKENVLKVEELEIVFFLDPYQVMRYKYTANDCYIRGLIDNKGSTVMSTFCNNCKTAPQLTYCHNVISGYVYIAQT